ncbi:MAG: hypothetical protein ACI8ZW_002293, partial [Yoonia sp.]
RKSSSQRASQRQLSHLTFTGNQAGLPFSELQGTGVFKNTHKQLFLAEIGKVKRSRVETAGN